MCLFSLYREKICHISIFRTLFSSSLVNAIFGKVGRTASKEVTWELLKSKCIPGFKFLSLERLEIVGFGCHSISYETGQVV